MSRIINLCSSSSGNCMLIQDKNTSILIDLGLSIKAFEATLKELDIPPSDIDAILLTHEHIDHVKGLGSVAKKYQIPVYASCGTLCGYDERYCFDEKCICYQTEKLPFIIGDFTITPFETSHDTEESSGYTLVDSCGNSIGFCTDLGFVSQEVEKHILGCDFVVLESNYDKDMLITGPYPYHLKRRISGGRGHLSNDEAAEFATKLVQNGTKELVLAHLSSENNTPQLAFENMKCHLSQNGFIIDSDYKLHIASKFYTGQIWEI